MGLWGAGGVQSLRHALSAPKPLDETQQFFKPNFVCLQIKQLKHIEKDFHSVDVAWVMPERWDFGVLGVKCLFFQKHGHVAYRIEGDDEKKRIQTKCVS